MKAAGVIAWSGKREDVAMGAEALEGPREVVLRRHADGAAGGDDAEQHAGTRPGGAAWPGRDGDRFTPLRVRYTANTYGLTPRLARLRARGLLTKKELAGRLGIQETTLTSWVKHGTIKAHAHNGHACLYEDRRPT